VWRGLSTTVESLERRRTRSNEGRIRVWHHSGARDANPVGAGTPVASWSEDSERP
jgi:hypothetical protein